MTVTGTPPPPLCPGPAQGAPVVPLGKPWLCVSNPLYAPLFGAGGSHPTPPSLPLWYASFCFLAVVGCLAPWLALFLFSP